ncbi:hypothetical protein F4774DRAFT_364991 [Daldinia eschscholtzii]|nr:hypothetical protein F4774DRAFT_364991 [Daldinia eschscholtzii]
MAIWAASGSLDMELSARNIEFAIGNNPFVMIYTTYLGRPNTYLGMFLPISCPGYICFHYHPLLLLSFLRRAYVMG